jgi:benzoyl-CoA 2,3-dioxygenase component A
MGLIKQHVIDPEICIRCNTCEETCPIDAVTHNDDNYVVDVEKCNYCMECISPCPTGSIDNWRIVQTAYTLDQQFEWEELPAELDLADKADEDDNLDALEDEVAEIFAKAHDGAGGKVQAAKSASKPRINLFNRSNPAIARVAGNFRITEAEAQSDVRHIVLDFGSTPFPVLEGQSIGIIPPGLDDDGKPHMVRLYSIASPRDGERPNTNNLALTVKRDITELDGKTYKGVASNFLCDAKKGDEIKVTGPFGATFLMPDDPAADIIMVCTGTGAAPFRGFTERRRRSMPNAPGKLLLYFGARRPEVLPYFGPLKKVPPSLLEQELVFSRLPGRRKEYVQDRMRARADRLGPLLKRDKTFVFVCGLKGMETGVDDAFRAICEEHALDWDKLRTEMRADGRYHVETY